MNATTEIHSPGPSRFWPKLWFLMLFVACFGPLWLYEALPETRPALALSVACAPLLWLIGNPALILVERLVYRDHLISARILPFVFTGTIGLLSWWRGIEPPKPYRDILWIEPVVWGLAGACILLFIGSMIWEKAHLPPEIRRQDPTIGVFFSLVGILLVFWLLYALGVFGRVDG